MADAFSSSSETVIQRAVDVTVTKTNAPPEKLEELYQIEKTCDFINEHQCQKVRTSLSHFVFTYVNISVRCFQMTKTFQK